MPHPMSGKAAICGLGMTEMGRVYKSATDLAVEAVRLALKDAGLEMSQLDGLLVNAGSTRGINLGLHKDLGLKELSVLTFMQGFGSSAGQMIQYAAMAVENGMADYIACVFADDPLKQGKRIGDSYASHSRPEAMASLYPIYGFAGAIPMYAMGAQRHMDAYGTTQEQLGQIAISQRQWAAFNENATMRKPMTMEDYHASPWVVEPFHIVDCCLVSNGGVAVIVTSAERAKDLKQPPVYVRGWAQQHNHDVGYAGHDPLLEGPGGSLPTNTGGGELSSFYMWGMTPVTEGVIQARGQGGDRQAPNDLVLVTGNGGVLNYHAALLLSPQAA